MSGLFWNGCGRAPPAQLVCARRPTRGSEPHSKLRAAHTPCPEGVCSSARRVQTPEQRGTRDAGARAVHAHAAIISRGCASRPAPLARRLTRVLPAILPSLPCIARVVQPHVQRHRVYTHGIHRRSSRVFGPSADHVRARRLEICAMSALCSVEFAHTSALLQCPSGTGCAYPLPADARRGPRSRARGMCGSLSCALEIQCPLGGRMLFVEKSATMRAFKFVRFTVSKASSCVCVCVCVFVYVCVWHSDCAEGYTVVAITASGKE